MINQDKDGYPTDESIQNIVNWEHTDGFHELMLYIEDYFNNGYGRCEYRDIDNTWEVATGGWSGCEEIIQALEENKGYFWPITWQLSKRGGYYEFKTKPQNDRNP